MYKYNDKEVKEILKTAVIIVDTREQRNEHIISYFEKHKIPWCNEKLDYGDYSIKLKSKIADRYIYCTDVVTIERKRSLDEISTNLTKERERFHNEFRKSDGKIYLLIENACYEDIELGNYNTQFNNKAFRKSLSSFEQKYNLHVHYQKNDKASGLFIYETLTAAITKIVKMGYLPL